MMKGSGHAYILWAEKQPCKLISSVYSGASFGFTSSKNKEKQTSDHAAGEMDVVREDVFEGVKENIGYRDVHYFTN